jgi:hypothetical protein
MSSFDLAAFQTLFSTLDSKPRDNYVHLAKSAEHSERYEEMCQFMHTMITSSEGGAILDEEERNLLSVAYKNVISAKRCALRALTGEPAPDELEQKLNQAYVECVEKELKAGCDQVIKLLEDYLIPTAAKQGEDGNEASVFYLKMAGDYCRYKAETSNDENDKQLAGNYYGKAYEIAQTTLKETHPIRLGLALNYSVCFYEILKDKKKACELAKTAFDDAIAQLDKLETTAYKDSTLIMQLLRDNLTLWTSSDEANEGNIEVEDISDEDAA